MTLSTIQRRYDLTSTESGLVVSVFDMAVIVSVIFVSYFGGKGHKPRWLGVGLLIQGLGEKCTVLEFLVMAVIGRWLILCVFGGGTREGRGWQVLVPLLVVVSRCSKLLDLNLVEVFYH